MAKYSTALRNARMTDVMNEMRSGTLVLCSGTPPGALAVPAAGVRLSEHAIGPSAGSVANGVLTFADADLATDAAANNTGTPSYVVALSPGGSAVAQWNVPSEITITINGGASTAITAGQETDVDAMSVTEGNP